MQQAPEVRIPFERNIFYLKENEFVTRWLQRLACTTMMFNWLHETTHNTSDLLESWYSSNCVSIQFSSRGSSIEYASTASARHWNTRIGGGAPNAQKEQPQWVYHWLVSHSGPLFWCSCSLRSQEQSGGFFSSAIILHTLDDRSLPNCLRQLQTIVQTINEV